jgi:hypothetical protein
LFSVCWGLIVMHLMKWRLSNVRSLWQTQPFRIFFTNCNMWLDAMSKKAVHWLGALSIASLALSASPVVAQTDPTIPTVISPLRVEPDVNGVNVVNGKVAILHISSHHRNSRLPKTLVLMSSGQLRSLFEITCLIGLPKWV